MLCKHICLCCCYVYVCVGGDVCGLGVLNMSVYVVSMCNVVCVW